jgi:uncharacterized membrane protein YGL010W
MVGKMEEHLLTALIVAPFFITMVGFAVAIALAPAVPNEIAPATEHNHEEMDHARSSGDGPIVKVRVKGKRK